MFWRMMNKLSVIFNKEDLVYPQWSDPVYPQWSDPDPVKNGPDPPTMVSYPIPLLAI
jgi:hypothetical protein